MRHFRIIAVTGMLLALFAYSCKKSKDAVLDSQGMEDIAVIPRGFPAINYPEGNEYTYERWSLGKQLFYDPIMSKHNDVSCASCHLSSYAFSDTMAFSLGGQKEKGSSNAPTLSNVAYQPYYTRAGGVATLEMQILVPIQEHNEFNTNILDIVEKLKKRLFFYVQQARKAYAREIDPYVITRAISNFERSLISGNSSYDQFMFQANIAALNSSAKRGMALFNSEKTNCSKCHSGFNFTNYAFENTGLYTHYTDSGRMRLTHYESDRDKFKVPTLRNIALTGPYMHDGSLKTLTEVIRHYNSGGVLHKNKSPLIKALKLTEQEQKDLLSFLQSLTDYSFVNNKNFKQ